MRNRWSGPKRRAWPKHFRIDDPKHSICSSANLSDLVWSDWFTDGAIYLHVAHNDGETWHRVWPRHNVTDTRRLEMRDGVLYWIADDPKRRADGEARCSHLEGCYTRGDMVEFHDRRCPCGMKEPPPDAAPKPDDAERCICIEYDGKGKSVCGFPCPVHAPKPEQGEIQKRPKDEDAVRRRVEMAKTLRGKYKHLKASSYDDEQGEEIVLHRRDCFGEGGYGGNPKRRYSPWLECDHPDMPHDPQVEHAVAIIRRRS